MRIALPTIQEPIATLLAMMQTERLGEKRQRLHALYLIARQEVSTKKDLARVLGVGRNAIGNWCSLYQKGGLELLLTIGCSPGRPPILNPEEQARVKEALLNPEGFASYGELRDWVSQTTNKTMTYDGIYAMVRRRWQAKLKTPRPSHKKKIR